MVSNCFTFFEILKFSGRLGVVPETQRPVLKISERVLKWINVVVPTTIVTIWQQEKRSTVFSIPTILLDYTASVIRSLKNA
jgi:hypothetical protein